MSSSVAFVWPAISFMASTQMVSSMRGSPPSADLSTLANSTFLLRSCPAMWGSSMPSTADRILVRSLVRVARRVLSNLGLWSVTNLAGSVAHLWLLTSWSRSVFLLSAQSARGLRTIASLMPGRCALWGRLKRK